MSEAKTIHREHTEKAEARQVKAKARQFEDRAEAKTGQERGNRKAKPNQVLTRGKTSRGQDRGEELSAQGEGLECKPPRGVIGFIESSSARSYPLLLRALLLRARGEMIESWFP